MYNVPSFTLARTIGGLMSWYWRQHLKREDTPIIIVASVSSHIPNHSPPLPPAHPETTSGTNHRPQGFVLGEGFLSIVNLILQSARVSHL